MSIRSIGAVLGIIAGAITIILGAIELWGLEGDGWAKVLAFTTAFVVVGLMLIIAYLVNLRQRHHETELRTARKARVAQALPDVHLAFHRLRDVAWSIHHGVPRSELPVRLVDALAAMAEAFSIIAGHPCRVCLKSLELEADAKENPDGRIDASRFYTTTYCRHDGTNPIASRGPDRLSDNSDFKAVWDENSPGRCFFSNDLDHTHDYVNSHRKAHDPDAAYNSAIVWPVQKREPDEKLDLWGFLCVDSQAKACFVEENDFELGAAFADTLYTVVAEAAPSASPSPTETGS